MKRESAHRPLLRIDDQDLVNAMGGVEGELLPRLVADLVASRRPERWTDIPSCRGHRVSESRMAHARHGALGHSNDPCRTSRDPTRDLPITSYR